MHRSIVSLALLCSAAACASTPPAQSAASPEPTIVERADEPPPISTPTETAEPTSESELPKAAPTESAPTRDPEATAPVPEADEPPPSDVPGSNLHVGTITTDGVTIENVACRSEGGGLGGLLGTLVIGKPFADRKSRLDQCVSGPQKTRVRWSTANGRMANVQVISGDNPANACIKRALEGAVATVAGECAASLEIGNGQVR